MSEGNCGEQFSEHRKEKGKNKMSISKLLSDLLEESENRYDSVLKVAQLAKQIKEETKEFEGMTNPVIQALQEIAAQKDGMLLVNSR